MYPVRLAPRDASDIFPTASTVRSTPVTSQGWRPVSVTTQPASTAIQPAKVKLAKIQSSQRGGVARLRRYQVPNQDSNSIDRPTPTMMRNAKKTGATGGVSG